MVALWGNYLVGINIIGIKRGCFFLCVCSRLVWSLRSKCPLWLFLIDVVNVAHLATLLGAFRITWACAQAAIVCVFQLTPLVRTKKNNACQLGLAVLTRCPGFCLFVWVFFPSSRSSTPPPTHHRLSPTWNDSLGGIKKESCASLCATDPSQGEAAEVDSRSLEEILGSIPAPPPPAMTNEAGAPRLMITHLVNRNFKSYAGEQILGPFHKVRPNMVTNPNWQIL